MFLHSENRYTEYTEYSDYMDGKILFIAFSVAD
jgi:hypothetical protein